MAFVTSYTSDQPVDDFGLGFSKLKFSASVPGSTEKTLTVPGDAPRYKVIMKSEASGTLSPSPVWVAVNATAALPAGADFALSTSELLPVAREVRAGDVLSFFTSVADTDVSVVFYALQTLN